ncbi:hypothetical protein [Bacillus sp. FJAT-28004]|uniref:hypothetical protein n=1 Tax=Bacillus sp. FJAT-28004 TaxID=1679165 RepID=UPI0006B41F3F|nr:hypothetical protein [Bacillus sp. FJAT-28004]
MPVLKEFDLDITYTNKAGTPEDYEVNWKQKRVQFRDEIRRVSSLYERSFDKFKTTDSWKVLIECVDEITDPGIKDFTGVCTAQVQFHKDTFLSMNDQEKKEITLKLLRKGIDKIISEKGWDSAPFNQAFDLVIKADMKNEWFWKKTFSSPDRKQKASLYIVHEVSVVKAYLIVIDKNNEVILRSEVFRGRPNEWDYAPYLGENSMVISK